MKRIFIYIFAATSFFYSSCSGDWLNLNPSTSVTSEQAIRTLEEAQIALNGIYRIAASTAIMAITISIMPIAGAKMSRRVSVKGPANVCRLIMNLM